MIHVFDNEELLPPAWRPPDASTVVRAFNPGLIRDGAGWLLAYRIVAEPDLRRRIAICRVGEDFKIIAGTQTAFSDFVRFERPDAYPPQATTWFADPRLCRLDGRLFIYWNSGWHEPQNFQFLQALDPISLQPVGAPRELVLNGTRQKLEKNWGLFESDDEQFAVYSANPHRVLSFSIAGAGPIDFSEAFPPVPSEGGFAQANGGLRGGAPPHRLGDHFYWFCHSIENEPGGYTYVPSVYRFRSSAPFGPTDLPRGALPLRIPASARRTLPRLNPAIGEIVYPAGAAYLDGKWMLSVGIDDERCAIAVVDHDTVLASLKSRG